MQDGFLSEVEHFGNVFQIFCRALDASLDLRELVHDRKDGVHGGVVDGVNLKIRVRFIFVLSLN